MPSFLDDITPFVGNGKINEDGQTLEEFLDVYDQSKYESPSVTADVMVFKGPSYFTNLKDDLSILMVKRRNHPCIGYWALPGGFIEMRENLEEAAKRELEEETGLSDVPIQLINTYGEVWRDPRNRLITTAFIAYVDNKIMTPKAGDDAERAEWFKIDFSVRGKSIVADEEKYIERKLYDIVLTGPDRVKCSATVKEDVNIKSAVRERKLTVVRSENIAFDHARFIVDGLLYLENVRKKG